ncbi:MAG: tetratricopeptide repeat protein [Armatimonadota bacterium]
MRPSRLAAMAALVALALVGAAPAQEGDPLAEGNALYRAGDFGGAVKAYREAISRGWDGPRTHYNLGTALYRSEQVGAAIAHFLAAARMAPRDPDIRANLQRALTGRPQGPPAPSPSWLHAAVEAVVSRFTLSELGVTAALLYWLAAAATGAALVQVRVPRSLRRAAIVLGVLTLLTSALAIGRWWGYHRVARGVVTAESAQIRTGPGESFEVAQTLTEGCLLRLGKADGQWVKAQAETGARGWLPQSAFTPVLVSAGGEEPDGVD